MRRTLIALALVAAVVALGWALLRPHGSAGAEENRPPIDRESLEKAYFAGGCFWCTESDFESVPGVAEAISGYAGGHVENPTYEAVSADRTGHLETVEVLYDPEKVTYEELLDVFWHSVDPTDDGGQFCDRGSSYRTAVFAADAEQRKKAEASKEEIERIKPFDAPVVTPIRNLEKFWPAEDYHQDYYETHPIRYKTYRTGCGRDARLRDLWGDEAYQH